MLFFWLKIICWLNNIDEQHKKKIIDETRYRLGDKFEQCMN